MNKVPHTLRPDAYTKMLRAKDLLECVLLYLSSIGHKPWRPNPLNEAIQTSRLADLKKYTYMLEAAHYSREAASPPDLASRELVSAFGVIEEILEYLDARRVNRPRAAQLEELTDVLFFYMEEMILGGFSWAEIEQEYLRKWGVNMERYRKARENDYSWDDRSRKEEL